MWYNIGTTSLYKGSHYGYPLFFMQKTKKSIDKRTIVLYNKKCSKEVTTWIG